MVRRPHSSALGVFSLPGLKALHEIWGDVDFCHSEGPEADLELTRALAERLDAQGLVTEAATDEHVQAFYHHWQLPMYNLKFGVIDVPLEELKARQEAAYWSEVGYQ